MDYKNGKIYCIRNKINDDVYIGSTTQPLSQRMAKHRSEINSTVKKKPATI
jgi:predicted GIY-YIG superfamily endonuclease